MLAREFESWLKRMPGLGTLPFVPEPRKLYSVGDLYRGYDPADPTSLTRSRDVRIYDWFIKSRISDPVHARRFSAVATRLHDTAIGSHILRFLRGSKSVGVMGGHEVQRTDPSFRTVALIARDLTQSGFTIVTGGGPGLMEAANFGAFMAPFSSSQFENALSHLTSAPGYDPKDPWLRTAAEVRSQLLGKWNRQAGIKSRNLGVPTWLYGTEPPNLFATHIGKYFYNSLREDGLVTICNSGIIFGPGSAGTVQEIFQDTTLNFYRKAAMAATPMVLFGSSHWNPQRKSRGKDTLSNRSGYPVYPLLEELGRAAKEPFDSSVLLTDEAEKVVQFIRLKDDLGQLQLRLATLMTNHKDGRRVLELLQQRDKVRN